jgi:hypothetical protein
MTNQIQSLASAVFHIEVPDSFQRHSSASNYLGLLVYVNLYYIFLESFKSLCSTPTTHDDLYNQVGGPLPLPESQRPFELTTCREVRALIVYICIFKSWGEKI